MYQSYLESLPNGIASHPQCEGKGALLINALEDRPLPASAHLDDIDDEITAMLRAPPPVSVWVSEVHLTAALYALADLHDLDRTAYEAWIAELSARLYRRPLYRFLMLVASPERLLRGADKRWSAFHRGTDLSTVATQPGRAECVLTRPGRVFGLDDGAVLIALKAAAEAAGGEAVETEILDDNDEKLRFALRWR